MKGLSSLPNLTKSLVFLTAFSFMPLDNTAIQTNTPRSNKTKVVGHLGLEKLVEHFIHPQNESNGERPRFSGSPAQYKLNYEHFRLFTNDGVALDSWYIPSTETKAVILAHGNGGSKVHMLKHAKFLNEAGYHTLLFDFRGQGNSEGSYVTYGYYEVRDVDAAVNELKRRGFSKIGILGISLGGSVAILSAARNKAIDAVVADCAFSDLDSVAVHTARKMGVPGYSFIINPLVGVVMTIGQVITGANYSETNPIDHIAKISPRPVLLIHGKHDTIVPFSNAQANYQHAEEPKELWVIQNGKHCSYVWNKKGIPGYEKKVLDFFSSALR